MTQKKINTAFIQIEKVVLNLVLYLRTPFEPGGPLSPCGSGGLLGPV